MPMLKSAKKRLRQDIKRNLRNKSNKSALKTQLKKFLDQIREGNIQFAEEEFRLATKKLDRCAAKGFIHKNTANRKKSRLARKLNQLKAAIQK